MKKVWLTALSKEMTQVQPLIAKLGTFGLECNGHYWMDDLKKMAWSVAAEKVLEHDLWLILADEETLATPSIRFGLSLCALSVLGDKGYGFPIVLLHTGEPPAADSLPGPLGSADTYKADDPVMPAKLVAKANVPPPKIAMDYKLTVRGLPQGTCFEVCPAEGTWSGALFGITDGEEDDLGAVAPGEAGKLPEKATLEYPMRDIKLALGDQEFVAAAFKNEVGGGTAVFALVHGTPDSVLFGPFSYDDSDAEFFTVRLK